MQATRSVARVVDEATQLTQRDAPSPTDVDRPQLANHWTKQRQSLLANPLTIRDGTIRVPAGWQPHLDEAALATATMGVHRATMR